MFKKLFFILVLIFASFVYAVDTKPTAGSSVDYGQAISEGIIGCWLLNENTGTSTDDASTTSANGTLVGTGSPAWTTGNFSGSAIDVNGTSGYVTMGDVNAIDGLEAFSIIAWVKLDVNTVSKTCTIIGKGNAHYAETSQLSLRLLTSTTGTERIMLVAYETPSTWWVKETGWQAKNTWAGKWSQIGVTYDGNDVIFYSNGSQLGSAASRTGPLQSTNYSLKIGSALNTNNENTYVFSGLIDNVIVWDRALSQSDISSLYTSPFQMFAESTPRKRPRIININMN